jgi:atypical dual specificity phosphatase
LEIGDIARAVYGYILGRPMNVSFIDDYVCGTARITNKRELKWLVEKKGIKAVLSLTETPISLNWVKGVVDYLHVAVPNHHAPTVSQLDECVGFIGRNVGQGNKVAVHCAAGQGRTGTVLAAYLLATKGISADEAIKTIRVKRRGSIERNSGQEESLKEYEEFLRNKKKNQSP